MILVEGSPRVLPPYPEELSESAKKQLEALGVFPRGRFGAWRYEVSNQDHSFMQGVDWVNRVLRGEPETVLTRLG